LPVHWLRQLKLLTAYYRCYGCSPTVVLTMTPITNRFFSFLCEPLASRNHALIVPCADYLIALLCSIGLGQLQSGMTMSGFGQLGQQSTGSLGSSLSLGNSGLPINSPSQSVYHTNYGLNSISKLLRALQEREVQEFIIVNTRWKHDLAKYTFIYYNYCKKNWYSAV